MNADNQDSTAKKLELDESALKILQELCILTGASSIGEVITDSIGFYYYAVRANKDGYKVGISKNRKLEKIFTFKNKKLSKDIGI